jgi:signal recognition particle GTPase
VRIAKGSGTHPQEVVLLLQEYHKFRNMVEKMGQMNIGGMGNDLQALQRNPKQFAQQMS